MKHFTSGNSSKRFLFNDRLRALHGCKPLSYDPELAEQAQKHARYLALKRRMMHSLALDYGENIAKKCGTPGFKLTGTFLKIIFMQ